MNCLIDNFRQTIPGIICRVSNVRDELENRHRGLPTQIQRGACLMLDFVDDIVDLLGHHNAVMQPVRKGGAHQFRVVCVCVCVDLACIGHGEVFPVAPAPVTAHHWSLPRESESLRTAHPPP